jgi:hypothetical protein
MSDFVKPIFVFLVVVVLGISLINYSDRKEKEAKAEATDAVSELVSELEDMAKAEAQLWKLFNAIAEIEGGHKKGADGEIGRYQIKYVYWKDSGVPGKHEDCWDPGYSERVMLAYWKRYGATTDEQRARMHHGGPKGHLKSSTLDYWERVRNLMECY